MLIAIPRDKLESAMERLTKHNVFFAQIGEIVEGNGIEVRGS